MADPIDTPLIPYTRNKLHALASHSVTEDGRSAKVSVGASNVLQLLDVFTDLEVEVDRLRAELAEARNAANEALGCRFIHDQCDCGDAAACGVCHMIERLRLLRDGDAKVQEAET